MDHKKEHFDLEGQEHGSRFATEDAGSLMSDRVGQQIETESQNTIKYRTCSWPKVSRSSLSEAIPAC